MFLSVRFRQQAPHLCWRRLPARLSRRSVWSHWHLDQGAWVLPCAKQIAKQGPARKICIGNRGCVLALLKFMFSLSPFWSFLQPQLIPRTLVTHSHSTMYFSNAKGILFQNAWNNIGFPNLVKMSPGQGLYLTYLTLCPQHKVWHGSLMSRWIKLVNIPVWKPSLTEYRSPYQIEFWELNVVKWQWKQCHWMGQDWLRDSTAHMLRILSSLIRGVQTQGPDSSWSLHVYACALRETLSCHEDGGSSNNALIKAARPPASNVHFCSVLSNVWHAICAQLMLATSSNIRAHKEDLETKNWKLQNLV